MRIRTLRDADARPRKITLHGCKCGRTHVHGYEDANAQTDDNVYAYADADAYNADADADVNADGGCR